MKKSILLVLVLAFGLVNEQTKADFTWTRKADMPTPRWSHTSAVVNGRLYIIGGITSESNERILSTVEEYDPVTNKWTRKADMPTARGEMGPSAVVDGKIYVIGGDQNIHANRSTYGSPTVEEYDPSTDTWTRKADMPTSRVLPGTCAVDGKVYAIGGLSSSGETVLSVVEQYDPITDTWTRKANMPTGVWCLSARVVNGKIYTLGGRFGSTAVPNMYEYDPAADTWTRKADMPVATNQIASGLIGNKIIVVGGWLWSYSYPYTTVQVYDPETDIWTREADVPFLRACVAGEVVNNRLYVIGGTDRPHPCVALSTVFEFGPLVDFNADGIVDIEDLVILIESWDTDNPLCDIAPPLYGDGIVDVLDLEAFMSSWQQEILPPELAAYWKLDEAEGSIAHDSVSDNHGILHGEPLWQPESGKKAGALQLDGIDDYVITAFVLDPSTGPFSVCTCIQGGSPGNVVISQIDGIGGSGENWLGTEPVSGKLMTGLVVPAAGRFIPKPLISESVITDGQWYHVGFVWDGSYRILYVDGVEVAKDTAAQNPLKSATGGLHIGADKTLGAGTFFSGMIDDVRIYNQALTTEEIAALAN
jgi:N-acetylneuraminic acid mutarotase